MAAPHLVTAEELERMGERDFDFELVRGKLVPVSPASRGHGALAGFLTLELGNFVRARRLGRTYVGETGYVLRRNPDTVRSPDLSIVVRERELAMRTWRGFIEGAPDFAVEIWSPDNTMTDLTKKAADYLDAGARLVWIVNSRARKVHVHRPGRAVLIRTGSDTLDGGSVLPGFRLPVARLFAELD